MALREHQPGSNRPDLRAFYRRWIVANGWSESVGLGSTFVVGSLAGPSIANATGLFPVLSSAFAAIVLGAALEGLVVGAAQEAVLRQRLIALKGGEWIRATAIGAGLAWALGMVPSTLMALADGSASTGPPAEPGALLQYSLAAALGAVAGPILGVAQWTVLRRHVTRATRWLWANALAWGIGMPLIFLGMDWIPWDGPLALRVPLLYLVCGGVGLVVGAVHGLVLRRLTPR